MPGGEGRIRRYQVRADKDGGATTGSATWTTQAATWNAAWLFGEEVIEGADGGRVEVTTTDKYVCEEEGAYLYSRVVETREEYASGDTFESLYTWTWADPQLAIPTALSPDRHYSDDWIALVEGSTSLGGEFTTELIGSVRIDAGPQAEVTVPAGTWSGIPLEYDLDLGGPHQQESSTVEASLGRIVDATFERVSVEEP